MDSSGNTVLITGGGSGIGLCLARAFKNAGSKVIITGRDQAKLEATGWDFKVADVTKQSDIEALYEEVTSKYGGINILINNAGIFNQIDYRQNTPIEVEEQFKEIDTNYKGPIRLTQTFLPKLKRKTQSRHRERILRSSICPFDCGSRLLWNKGSHSFMDSILKIPACSYEH